MRASSRRLPHARPMRLRREGDQPLEGPAAVEQQVDGQHQRDADATARRSPATARATAGKCPPSGRPRRRSAATASSRGGIRAIASWRTSSKRPPSSAACSFKRRSSQVDEHREPATTMASTTSGAAKRRRKRCASSQRHERVEPDREERGHDQQQHPFPDLQPEPHRDQHHEDPDDGSCPRCRCGWGRSWALFRPKQSGSQPPCAYQPDRTASHSATPRAMPTPASAVTESVKYG